LKGDKKIPAAFFTQPLTENISAVLANPAGTIVKFNRMGFLAGFGERDLLLTRTGKAYRGSVNPEVFSAAVHSSGYTETWVEGLNVYHNPNALHPLDPHVFPGAAHHTSRDGRILSRMPPFHPIGSITSLIVPTDGPNDSAETGASRSHD
jgi:hypothetical protein